MLLCDHARVLTPRLQKIEKTLKENSDLKNQINEDEKTLASLDQMLRKMDQELEEKVPLSRRRVFPDPSA
jgi:predicted RNase H-like nuclease (RuvC/YqgF family)